MNIRKAALAAFRVMNMSPAGLAGQQEKKWNIETQADPCNNVKRKDAYASAKILYFSLCVRQRSEHDGVPTDSTDTHNQLTRV